ncbi:MAG: peptidoglycan DD-metalloendopeptidase family protein [Pseudomonadota bacterium]|nr:peptidoglycan DD-metalloendopeptidase family protein [Pseudomonadota bacterium]
MKNHFRFSVSHAGWSRHFHVHHLLMKLVGLTFIAAIFVMVASNLTLSGERQRMSEINAEKTELENKLQSLADTTQALEDAIDVQVEDVATVNRELANLERKSGLEADNRRLTISERIRLLRKVHTDRENEYAEIGDKVDRIEEIIGLAGEKEAADLGERVEMVELGVQQERLLHDYLPSGYPLGEHKITSGFGFRTHPKSGTRRFHNGIDLRAKTSTPVYATADGVVKESVYSDSTGQRIVVQHNLGFETSYFHLAKRQVKKGDIVEKGQKIGLSGNTGRSAAPHLHYEVRYLGKALNPRPFLDWEVGSKEIFAKIKGVQWKAMASLVKRQIGEPVMQLSRLESKYRREN